jgi:selenocysteine lyase/cysteine desulfurase
MSYSKFLYKNIYHIKTGKSFLMCDQTSSGFPLKCVETYLQDKVYPFYTNTHSNNKLGIMMAEFIQDSKIQILKSIHANDQHKIIFTGSGASGAINHLVHLIKPKLENAVVFISIYEHYSNYLPWYHNTKHLVILDTDSNGLVDQNKLKIQLTKYNNQGKDIFVSLSACSNVTGVIQDTKTLSELCKKFNAKVFFDYAASAPYVPIDMTIADGIFISPHKFPGAQSSPGILVINKDLVCNGIPYCPGGGTVKFLDKSSGPIYSSNIETKETGGTPNILGIIKCGLAFKIKDKFSKKILKHELELTHTFQKYLLKIQKKYPNLKILNPVDNINRLPIFAIQIEDTLTNAPFHYNFIVALLSDIFSITTRGGISCSGIFADKLLNINTANKLAIKNNIINNNGTPGNFGWVRITLNSIHTKKDLVFITKALKYICKNAHKYITNYTYIPEKNIYKQIKKISSVN